MQEFRHTIGQRIARFVTSGEFTFGLRGSIVVATCAVLVSIVGAIALS
jgi:hypothetical protein